jgi:hypothetical protein
MIGNPKWFTYRIFGWGIGPKTWQGWVYIAAVVALAGIIAVLPVTEAIRMWLYIAVVGIVVLDALHIMLQLGKVHDERENYNQLLIERNVSFGAIVALLVVAIYQTYQNKALAGSMLFPFDTSIAIVLGAMLVVKIASTIYVKVRM